MKILSQIKAAGIGQGVNGLMQGTGEINWADAVRTVIEIIFVAVVGAMFVYFVWGAVDMITASGEKTRMEKGRRKMIFAAAGAGVAAGGFVVWRLILMWAGVSNVDFGGL